jgi:hypothetical protein
MPHAAGADVARAHHAAFCFETLVAALAPGGGASAPEASFDEAHWWV